MSDFRVELKSIIDANRKWADTGSRAWSVAYHVALGTAAILGVVVASLSGLDAAYFKLIGKDLAIAILSLTAAVLTSIATIGGFERKWVRNRTTRQQLDGLVIDWYSPNVDDQTLADRLKLILEQHNGMIVPPAS